MKKHKFLRFYDVKRRESCKVIYKIASGRNRMIELKFSHINPPGMSLIKIEVTKLFRKKVFGKARNCKKPAVDYVIGKSNIHNRMWVNVLKKGE